MDTPFYLQTNEMAKTNGVIDVYKATQVDFKYDYSQSPAKQDAKDFWQDMADNTSEAANASGKFVWNTAKGAWDTAKAGATAAIHEVTDFGGELKTQASGLFDSLLWRIVLIFAAFVIGVWILAKAGVIRDVAEIFKV